MRHGRGIARGSGAHSRRDELNPAPAHALRVARIQPDNGDTRPTELHWHKVHGIGRRAATPCRHQLVSNECRN